MSEHATNTGVCPACHREGRVGYPCEHGACAREGVHFIPQRFAPQGRRGDPRLGHVLGSHLLVERLHRPGIDTAYRAIQLPAQLEVELAFVPAAREKEVHDNLFRQALALGRLGAHPHVTRLVFFGVETAGTFLATDGLADVSTLAEVVSTDGNDVVPAAGARLLLEPLASALVALARSHLAHGEIRPEHVLVETEPGRPPFVRLGGFVRVPSAGPAPAHGASDLVWRPPELIFQHTVNKTTDPYAVAAIAFCLLFGRPPFPAGDRDRLLGAKRDASWDPTEGLAAAAPPEVIHFFQGALSYDPAERLSGDGFYNALVGALDAFEAAEAGEAEAEVEAAAPPPLEEPDRHERPPRFHHEAAPAGEDDRGGRPPRFHEAESAGDEERGGRPPRFHHDAARVEEDDGAARAGRPPRFHHEGEGAPVEAARAGRPPRFHHDPGQDQPARVEHAAQTPQEPPRAGITQHLVVQDLEEPETRRPPRMHKDK